LLTDDWWLVSQFHRQFVTINFVNSNREPMKGCSPGQTLPGTWLSHLGAKKLRCSSSHL
jgi:hypothetical protein